MKKINRLENIFYTATALVFCLCALTATSTFGQVKIPDRARVCVKSVGYQDRLDENQRYCGPTIGSLRSAGLLIYGIELKPDSPSDDETIIKWIQEINQNPTWKTKFNEGFTASDGLKFLKERFTTVGDGWLEIFVGTITDQIYGRMPTKAEKDFYVPRLKGQNETYASIFLAEKNKLNKNSAERQAMINRAYQQTMGRVASEGDLKYWLPRTEIYKELVAASRTYLYSPNGAKDLKETVTRAYQTKYKGSPLVESRIAKLTADFTPKKMIYAEMIK